MKDQKFTNWEILWQEEGDYEFGWIAGDKEQELQKLYGYKIDKNHYQKSREVRRQQGFKNAQNGHLTRIRELVPSQKGKPLTEKQLTTRRVNNLIRSSSGGKATRKLTIDQAKDLIALRKNGKSLKELSEIYKITVSTVSKIARGQGYN